MFCLCQNVIATSIFRCIYVVFVCLYVRPLGPENLLLRGARLKNTKEIYGESIQLESKERVLQKQILHLRGKQLGGKEKKKRRHDHHGNMDDFGVLCRNS